MADENDRKWLPPTDPDDDRSENTLPGVPGSFSGSPDVPGGDAGLSSGDPLGGGTSEGGGLWSSQSGAQEPTPPPPAPPPATPSSAWGAPSEQQQQPQQQPAWGPPSQQPQQPWGAPPSQPQQTFPPYGQPQSQPSSAKGIAAIVLGVLGLTFCPVIGSGLALVFGYLGKSEADRAGGQGNGRGLSLAGIVLGWVGLVGTLLIIILLATAVVTWQDLTGESWDDFWDTAVVLV
jgi:hypothetical protein